MKKHISLIAAALSIALCACSSSGSAATPQSAQSSGSASEEKTETVQEEKPAKLTVTFEGDTVVDNEEVSWKITGIDLDTWAGSELTFDLENKSDEKTYMFALEGSSVNCLEVSDWFAEEVAPGKKSHTSATIMTSEAKDAGIQNFTDITISYRVYDNNDWMADAVAEGTMHIYPYGEDKAEKYSRTSESSDIVLVDNDQAAVIVTGYDSDGLLGYDVNLYLVNKTASETLMYAIEETSVNDYMIDPFWARTVQPGHSAFTSMTFFKTDLEDSGIDTVEKIEGIFKVYETNSWDSYYFNDTIILEP